MAAKKTATNIAIAVALSGGSFQAGKLSNPEFFQPLERIQAQHVKAEPKLNGEWELRTPVIVPAKIGASTTPIRFETVMQADPETKHKLETIANQVFLPLCEGFSREHIIHIAFMLDNVVTKDSDQIWEAVAVKSGGKEACLKRNVSMPKNSISIGTIIDEKILPNIRKTTGLK